MVLVVHVLLTGLSGIVREIRTEWWVYGAQCVCHKDVSAYECVCCVYDLHPPVTWWSLGLCRPAFISQGDTDCACLTPYSMSVDFNGYSCMNVTRWQYLVTMCSQCVSVLCMWNWNSDQCFYFSCNLWRVTNLKYWTSSRVIVKKTLQLLNDLSVG